jgi:hypothetical protein
VLAEQKENVKGKGVVRETFIFEKRERHFVRFPRVSPVPHRKRLVPLSRDRVHDHTLYLVCPDLLCAVGENSYGIRG